MFRWENFTTANGLPDNHVFCVLVDGNRIWAAPTMDWASTRTAHGRSSSDPDAKEHSLAHHAVLSLALDKNTGDVWAGTMGGLSRISAGRIDTFTQLNSGLSNDVVYGVGVQGDYVWIATAAGASRLNTHTGQWSLYQRAQHAHVRDLDLRGQPRGGQGLLRGLGRRRARVRPEDRALEGLQRSRRRDRDGRDEGPGT